MAINGTPGADTLPGTSGDDVINGLGGADKIDGGAGNDTIDGGSGNDIIKGGDGDDTITGGSGNDNIVGGAGRDTAVYSVSVASAANTTTAMANWAGAVLNLGAGVDGIDALNQVEVLRFNGQDFTVTGYNRGETYNVVANLGADSNSGNQDAPITGNVLANDYDIDSALTVTGARTVSAGNPAMPVNDPKAIDQHTADFTVTGSYGTLYLFHDGSYDYVATGQGTDHFQYSVTDGGVTRWVNLDLTATHLNHAPVANAGSASTAEDSALSGQVTASDQDSDPLTYSLVSGPSHGSLSFNSDGSYNYTPDANYHGSDSFTFRASDGSLSSTASVALTVTSINDVPTVSGASNGADEDTNVTGQVYGHDVDGDSLTFHVVTGPSHGSLDFHSDGSYTYVPDANFHGSDSFTFAANDGTADSGPGTVNLTVASVNDAPVAQNASFSAAEDTVISGHVSATDADGDSLTYSVVSGPQHGSLTFNSDGTFTYTPDANYHGSDSFTYKASDGSADSNDATGSVTLTSVNDAPTASGGSNSTNEDTSVTGQVAGGDVDNDPLTFHIVSGPSHGSLTFHSDGSYTYVPNANYNGSDSFTFASNDGATDSSPATVSLTVNSVNDAPVAADASASTNEDTALSGSVHATDVDGDSLTYSVASTTQHGSLSFNSDGSYTYTPAADYHGSDGFDYQVSDGHGGTDYGHVALNVASVNDAPVVTPRVTVSTFEGSDPFRGMATAGHTGAGPAPAGTGFSGQAGLLFGDGIPIEQIAAFSGVTMENLLAVIPGTISTGSGMRLDFDSVGAQQFEIRLRFATADAANGDASYFLVDGSGQVWATRTLRNGSVTRLFTNAMTEGHHTLYLVVVGGGDAGAVPQVQIDGFLLGGAAASIDVTHSYVKEDSVLNSHVYATDPDGDAVTFAVASNGGPAHGVLTLNSDGSFHYTPDANYNGTDSFTFTVDDGHGGVTTATQAIIVESVNDVPVTSGASFNVDEDQPLSGHVSATDADGDSLTFTLGTGVSHGSLSFNSDGTFTYTPAHDYNGSDSFTYSVSDGHGGTTSGTVNLTVVDHNYAPVATGASSTLAEDSSVSGSVTATDQDHDALTYSLVGGPSHGSLTFNTDGTYFYTPDANYNGSDSFTFKANDGTADSNTATVNLTVTAVNDAPVASPVRRAGGNEDSVITGAVHGSDADGDSLTFELVGGAPAGLTFNSDGSWSFDPTHNATLQALNTGEFASVSFDFRAYDGHDYSATVTQTISISGISEVQFGTTGKDTLTGTDYGDYIGALAGDDTIRSGLGNDVVYADDGSDKIYGGDGIDELHGGNGNDTINGEAGDDVLVGDAGDDTMDGGDGVDQLFGGDGNDVAKGGAGIDYVHGGAGNDDVQGGVGDDFVYGDAGADRLSGGTGADRFVFADGDLGSTLATSDVITDFKTVQGDVVDFSAIDADTITGGDQAFSLVGSFGHHAGEMTMAFNAGINATVVSLDTNGDGVADYVLQITGNVSSTAGWVL